MKWKKRFQLAAINTACWLFTSMSFIFGQVNTGGPNTTNDHSKQVIGYITEWDAWKATNAGLPAQGALTQLNIDYSRYTILNYSFFGVAKDGSLHSGDLRNKNIYMEGEVQQPGDIFYTDIYSSWDLYILFGELEIVQYISQDVAARAQAQGFDVQVNGTTWSNPAWGLYDKPLPLPLKKEGGAGGLLDLAHQNGVKVMASIGGWSMCKHYPEMAADPARRARFVEDCKKLINIGFDGIDLDWEYPGFGGMNFTGTQADFANFATLVQEIRAAIGPDKLLTAAMSADPAKLDGFDWSKLVQTMDYFNMMTYDFNGGWSDIAGHNAPLYAYDGAEAPTFNWNSTCQKLVSLGVPTNMVNMGCPFYGRGVVCQNTAALNATTQKTSVTIQPDGPITTCADYTNWPLDVYDGTPNYFYIKQKTGLGTTNGWIRHWDDQAKVPYLTNGKYFLSYDDEESIGLKAQYILDKQLAGTIIWTVFGDLEIGGTATNFGTKLKRWSDVKSTLVNKINEVFATGGTCTPDNITSYVAINDGSPQQATNVTVDAGSKVDVSPQPGTGTWSWTGPNGFSSSSNKITLNDIQTSSAGTYTGTLTNAGGCTSSVSVTINVNDWDDPEDGIRIVGYIPSWKGDAPSVQYDKLTHIIYAFITPNASGDGSLGAIPNVSKLQQIVGLAHAKGVKVSIAVGGWSDLNNPGFEGLSSTVAGRENFANSLLALCNQYGLDGVDIDWEYPIGYTGNFASMMQTLATTLHANGKILSAAVPGGDYYGQYVNLDALNALDFLNIMAYDGDSGAGHSPYSFAVSALNYWSGKGMANDKAVLGVPFYSRPSSISFADLLAQGASADEDYYNGEYYNGIPTIRQKSELAKSYGGIMIWELTHDAAGENSLLSAIYEVIYGGTVSLTVNIGGPYSGKVNTAITFSGTASGGTGPYSYSWNFGDGSTGTGNSTSHTYTTAGNYTVTLTVSDATGKTATNTATATIDGSGDDGSTCWTDWAGGAYNGGAQVSYNGVNYQAKWWTDGVPGVDDTWENKGTCDGPGTGDETGTCWAEWIQGAYNGGAQVSYKGINYQAKWWTNGVPGVDNTWENMGTCDGSGTGDNGNTCWTAWVEGAYSGGAQVSYNGINYRAKWWTNGVPGVDNTWENMGTCGNPDPGLVISAGNSYSGKVGVSVTFTGSASEGTSPGDGTTGNGNGPVHTYSLAGKYTVTLTVTDVNNSFAIENHTFLDGYKNAKTLPFAPEQTSSDITLYPNPVENTLMINGISGISHINIYDMIGQKVIEATTQPVDVSGLKTGTYILKVSSENNNTQKIFIKN